MNWRYIFIGLIIFIPFIMMGKNPFMADGPPPNEFKDGIRSKISQPAGGFSGTGSLIGGSSGNLTNMPNPGSGFGNFGGTAPSAQSNQNPMINPGTPNAGLPTSNNVQNIGIAPPSQAVEGNNNPPSLYNPQPLQQPYTQPAPFRNLPTPGSRMELPKSYPRFNDQKGRLVAFVGVDVYTTDRKGIAKLMPDGVYTLNNGHELIVKNGKKWLPKDDNKLIFSESQPLAQQ